MRFHKAEKSIPVMDIIQSQFRIHTAARPLFVRYSFLILLWITSISLFGQNQTTVPVNAGAETIGRIINEKVTLNLTDGTISPQSLPFDVPFLLVGEAPANITQITITIIEKDKACLGANCDSECRSCKEMKKETDTLVTKSRAQLVKLAEGYSILRDLTPSDSIIRRYYEKTVKVINEEVNERKEKVTCDCDECTEADFSTCYQLCPWTASHLSRVTTNSVTVNKFSISVPPLRANRQYRFYVNVERSNGAELQGLSTLVVPILRQAILSDSTRLPLSSQLRVLQQAIRETIVADYLNVQNIKVPISGTLIHERRLSQFDQLILTERSNSQDINTYLTSIRNQRAQCNADRDAAVASWGLMLSVDYRLMTTRLGRLLTPTAFETNLALKMVKLNLLPPILSYLSVGRCNPDQLSDLLPILETTQTNTEVGTYLANIKKTQSLLTEIASSLDQVEVSSEARRRIFFEPAQLTEYETLRSSPNRTPPQEDQFNRYEAEDQQNATRITGIKSNVNNLLLELMSVQADLQQYQNTLTNVNQYFVNVSSKLFQTINMFQATQPTTTADFVSRTSYYVSADVGLAYVRYQPQFGDEVIPYAGVNFQLGPINKQRDYSLFAKCKPVRSFYKNTSIIVGIALTSLSSGRRGNSILGGNSILTGLGIRISDPIRFSGGFIWNKVQSPNPLVEKQRLQGFPYFAVSYDLDVAKYLRIFGQKVFGLQ